MADPTQFSYVTYIAATPEALWKALTDAEMTALYWGHANVSDHRPGSRWEHRRTDGSGIADIVGEVRESEAPRKLVLLWRAPADPSGPASEVSFVIEPKDGFVKLSLCHRDLAAGTYDETVAGWSAVLSNLKTFLESGKPLPAPPWL